MIYICSCVDTETAIFCITADENVALSAVKRQIDNEWDSDEDESIAEVVERDEYVISCVKDGEPFWWRDGEGGIGQDHLEGEELAERLEKI